MKYSQNDEESFILKHFEKLQNGYFLDIGAYDGKTFSNTHALALRGWKGVCIEPSPKVYPALEELYKGNKNVKLLNYCIGKDEDVTFWDAAGDAIGSTSFAHVQKWESYGTPFNEITLPSISVETLYKKAKIKKVDFLNIDVESDDLGFEILQQIDLTDIKMVCIESGSNRPEVLSYLQGHGFSAEYENAENLLVSKPYEVIDPNLHPGGEAETI